MIRTAVFAFAIVVMAGSSTLAEDITFDQLGIRGGQADCALAPESGEPTRLIMTMVMGAKNYRFIGTVTAVTADQRFCLSGIPAAFLRYPSDARTPMDAPVIGREIDCRLNGLLSHDAALALVC